MMGDKDAVVALRPENGLELEFRGSTAGLSTAGAGLLVLEKPEKPFCVDVFESLFDRLPNGFDDAVPNVELEAGADGCPKPENGAGCEGV